MSDTILAKKIFTKSNLIIISLVSFFSLQYLAYISIFSVNFPYSSDVPDIVYFTYDFIKTGKFDLFGTVSGHLFVFPRIISFLNLYYNSFDIINIIYYTLFCKYSVKNNLFSMGYHFDYGIFNILTFKTNR